MLKETIIQIMFYWIFKILLISFSASICFYLPVLQLFFYYFDLKMFYLLSIIVFFFCAFL